MLKKFNYLFISVWLVKSCLTAAAYPNTFKAEFNKEWESLHAPFVIHAIPKCGVHQLQRLMHLLIPEDVELAFCDKIPSKHFYQNKLIMRTHEPFTLQSLTIVKNTGYKMIAIIRDPRDALISHLHYMRMFAQQPHPPTRRDFFIVDPKFDSLSLDEQVKSLIIGGKYSQSYIKCYKEGLGFALSGYPLVIKYETLQPTYDENLRSLIIEEIATYLEMQLSKEHLDFILANLHDNQFPYASIKPPENGQEMMDGKTYTRASTDNWKIFLSEENKKLLKSVIGKELITLGYAEDFDW